MPRKLRLKEPQLLSPPLGKPRELLTMRQPARQTSQMTQSLPRCP
jgi:hypothetical protein